MQAAVLKPSTLFGSYDEIADEYYDPARHPTCASLRELSEKYLSRQLESSSGDERLILEVGAGRSIVAPIWQSLGRSLNTVLLLDSSPDMLAYSVEWGNAGASLAVAEAEATGLPDGSMDLIVASLGDPYNTASFWREVARVLRTGGLCHFTTPAHEWAQEFRSLDEKGLAEFIRADGTVLFVPSLVHAHLEQMNAFSAAALKLIHTEALTLDDLTSAPAPKLICAGRQPVLRGYTVQKHG